MLRLSCRCWISQEFHAPGGDEGCLTLNNQRPMIESHLGHHSDTDVESVALADEHEYAVEWSHNRDDDAGRSSKDRRPGAESEDNLSQLLDRRQQLEV